MHASPWAIFYFCVADFLQSSVDKLNYTVQYCLKLIERSDFPDDPRP